MPDPVAQLGVAGFVVALMAIALKVIWDKYQAALADKDRITETVLPVLERATEMQRQALEESIRSRALAEREGR